MVFETLQYFSKKKPIKPSRLLISYNPKLIFFQCNSSWQHAHIKSPHFCHSIFTPLYVLPTTFWPKFSEAMPFSSIYIIRLSRAQKVYLVQKSTIRNGLPFNHFCEMNMTCSKSAKLGTKNYFCFWKFLSNSFLPQKLKLLIFKKNWPKPPHFSRRWSESSEHLQHALMHLNINRRG